MTARSLIHIDVVPTQAYEQRTRLFRTLESAFPVRFQPAGNGKPDATVAFLTAEPEQPTISGPTLVLIDRQHAAADQFGAIDFGDSALLPRPFRGRTLTDSSASGGALPEVFEEWGDVLATCSAGPVWSGRAGLQYVASSWPAELDADELLRGQLTSGRFMGLLPLAHFLQQLSAQMSWVQPESRACFVFDDPNLHWWSYGFLDYRQLLAHADVHDYRVTAATIPLDQWYIHSGTAEFLRQQSRISFAVHGNNHTQHELRQVDELGRASALATQALRRGDAVRRAGIEISPVMVPPYGVCSIAMFEGCLRAGFDAVCADWPYWWLLESDAVSPLSGWSPLDRLAGLPLISRLHVVDSDLDDLVFRAFLGQPLVLYAHHTDLKAGLDVLAVRADHVRSLGVDAWASLGSLAQDVAATRRHGTSIDLTLYSRRAVFSIPDDVSDARFVVSGTGPSETELRLEISDNDGSRAVPLGERVPVNSGVVVATLTAESFPEPPQARRQVRGALRRLVTEGRDRAAPLSSRIGRAVGISNWSIALSLVGCLATSA